HGDGGDRGETQGVADGPEEVGVGHDRRPRLQRAWRADMVASRGKLEHRTDRNEEEGSAQDEHDDAKHPQPEPASPSHPTAFCVALIEATATSCVEAERKASSQSPR